jgi:staphylococcal nuclease domain-containing protein 1
MSVTKLRPLDPSFFSLAPPLATEMVLAFVKTPKESNDYFSDCGAWFGEVTYGRELVVETFYRDEATNKLAVVLVCEELEEQPAVNVNASLLEYGLARTLPQTNRARAFGPAELLTQLDTLQEQAKKSRVGMFQYGDPGDSDEEDQQF